MKRIILMLALLFSLAMRVGESGAPISGTRVQFRVSITFDDGYVSAYRASSILDKAGVKATFFIISRCVGQPNYMTREEVMRLAAEGHEIGSHTRNHPHLRRLSLARQESEIGGSLKDFSEWGLRPTSFAYPFGQYNDNSFIALKDAGFTAARTTDAYKNNTNPYLLSGYTVNSKTKLKDIITAIQNAQRNGKWLIIVFHRVDERFDNPINTKHEIIQGLVDYLVQNKVKVVTIGQRATSK